MLVSEDDPHFDNNPLGGGKGLALKSLSYVRSVDSLSRHHRNPGGFPSLPGHGDH